jgi:heterodisulfide reductase subunit B
LVGDIVAAALRAGADGLVTDCPMCQVNVESRQFDLSSTDNLPVFFGTELISAALNGQYPAKQEKMHLVDADILTNVIKTVPQSREETV